ncbi:MAG: ribonuclease Y [Acidobacteriota bacterium]
MGLSLISVTGALIAVIGALISLALAILAGARKHRADLLLNAASEEARRIVSESQRESENLKKEATLAAKEKLLAMEDSFAESSRGRKRELDSLAERLDQREESLDRRVGLIDRKEYELVNYGAHLKTRADELARAESHLAEILREERRKLEEMSGLTADAARSELMRMIELDTKQRAALAAKRIEDEAVAHADAKARTILGTAMQRIATSYCIETTVSVLDLPSDEMKGRIIGREGRNIRALEKALGVDLIVDDTPNAILLSSFDPIRREVGKLAITELIRDGRIHPARIEEAVAKARRDIETNVRDIGQDAVTELGFPDMHADLVRVVGRMKYRTSYGQNILLHSREVAHLAGVMAAEMGANVEASRRGGFLHDIGKAIDREVEGTHTQIGVELAKKLGERPEVIHCIAAHHMDIEFGSVEAMIVQAADALSAGRPGARREILETYVKRLEKLEAIASSFAGVSKSYAIQAGREVRILVESDKVSDADTLWLSKDIARKIEGELSFPGQVKVTVIREVRAIDYAR